MSFNIYPYPNFDSGYVGVPMKPIYPPYLSKIRKYSAGTQAIHNPSICIDSNNVESSFGFGIPVGVFVRLNAIGGVDYLTVENSFNDLFGITLLNLDYDTSKEGIPGIQNHKQVCVARPFSSFTCCVFISEHFDPTKEFGIVVKSNSITHPLGALTNHIDEPYVDDLKTIAIPNGKVRIIEIEENLACIEFLCESIVEPTPPTPPANIWPVLDLEPTWVNISRVFGGFTHYLNNPVKNRRIIDIDRDTGMLRTYHTRFLPSTNYSVSTPRMAGSLFFDCITRQTKIVLSGGVLGKFNTVYCDFDNNFSSILQRNIADLPAYSIEPEEAYSVSNGTMQVKLNPGNNGSDIIYVGGTIAKYGEFGEVSLHQNIRTNYLIDSIGSSVNPEKQIWEDGNGLTIVIQGVTYQIDMTQANICKITDTLFWIAGVKTFSSQDPWKRFVTIYTYDITDINNPVIGQLDHALFGNAPELAERVNVFSRLIGGTSQYCSETDTVYFINGTTTVENQVSPFMDTLGNQRLFGILKIENVLASGGAGIVSDDITTILGDLKEGLPEEKLFDLVCPYSTISEDKSKIFIYGGLFQNGIVETTDRNIVITFSTITDTHVINTVNHGINTPLQSVCVDIRELDPPIPVDDPWPVLTGSPTWEKTAKLMGGMFVSPGDPSTLVWESKIIDVDLETKMVRYVPGNDIPAEDITTGTVTRPVMAATNLEVVNNTVIMLGGCFGKLNTIHYTANQQGEGSFSPKFLKTVNGLSTDFPGISESDNYLFYQGAACTNGVLTFYYGGKVFSNEVNEPNHEYYNPNVYYIADVQGTGGDTNWHEIGKVTVQNSGNTYEPHLNFMSYARSDFENSYHYVTGFRLYPVSGAPELPQYQQMMKITFSDEPNPNIGTFQAELIEIVPDNLNQSIDEIKGYMPYLQKGCGIGLDYWAVRNYYYFMSSGIVPDLSDPTGETKLAFVILRYCEQEGNCRIIKGPVINTLSDIRKFCMIAPVAIETENMSVCFLGGSEVTGDQVQHKNLVIEVIPGNNDDALDQIIINTANDSVELPNESTVATIYKSN